MFSEQWTRYAPIEFLKIKIYAYQYFYYETLYLQEIRKKQNLKNATYRNTVQLLLYGVYIIPLPGIWLIMPHHNH